MKNLTNFLKATGKAQVLLSICLIFAIFSLELLIKVFLVKKRVIQVVKWKIRANIRPTLP